MKNSLRTDELRVLFLEDEVLIALDIADQLADRGLSDVKICHREGEAMAALDAERFDVAVLDVNLGGGRTSHQVAERCVALGLPVIFCTGYNRSEEITAAFDAQVVPKPVDADELVAAIERVAPVRA